MYDPDDPMGKMFLNILATFAEFEVDLLRLKPKERMTIARACGGLKGRRPKLSVRQRAELRRMHSTGEYTIAELTEVFSVAGPRYTASSDVISAAVPQLSAAAPHSPESPARA